MNLKDLIPDDVRQKINRKNTFNVLNINVLNNLTGSFLGKKWILVGKWGHTMQPVNGKLNISFLEVILEIESVSVFKK